MMSYLFNVNHPDELIDRKINYFYDKFIQANTHLGKIPRFEFKCPSYILASIDYQLNENYKNCVPYISSLLNRLNERDMWLIANSSVTSRRKNFLENLLSLNRKHKLRDELQENGTIIKKRISAIAKQVKEKELKLLVETITTNLMCPHALSFHKKVLDYSAVTLVSIYRFNGKSKVNVRKEFSHIFNGSKQTFPFPKSILEIQDEIEKNRAKADFLTKRNLRQQLNGMYNLLQKKPKKSSAIFRILNVKTETDDFEFAYNGVRVLGQNHSEVKRIKSGIVDDDWNKDFLEGDNYLVTLVEVEIHSDLTDVMAGLIQRLEKVVQYINDQATEKLATLDRSKYLLTRDYTNFGSSYSAQSTNIVLRNFNISRLQNSAATRLNGIDRRLAEKITSIEHLYWSGKSTHNYLELWQFLENSTPLSDTGKREVKKFVSNILLRRTKVIIENIYSADVVNCVGGLNPIDQNIFDDEFVKDVRLNNSSNINVKEDLSGVEHPFIRSIRKSFVEDNKKSNRKVLINYWKHLVTECMAYRNMIVHDGRYNELLKIKLSVCMPYLATNYFYSLIRVIIDNKHRKNYNKLMNNIMN